MRKAFLSFLVGVFLLSGTSFTSCTRVKKTDKKEVEVEQNDSIRAKLYAEKYNEDMKSYYNQYVNEYNAKMKADLEAYHAAYNDYVNQEAANQKANRQAYDDMVSAYNEHNQKEIENRAEYYEQALSVQYEHNLNKGYKTSEVDSILTGKGVIALGDDVRISPEALPKVMKKDMQKGLKTDVVGGTVVSISTSGFIGFENSDGGRRFVRIDFLEKGDVKEEGYVKGINKIENEFNKGKTGPALGF